VTACRSIPTKFVLATAIAGALLAVLAATSAGGTKPRQTAVGSAGPHVSVTLSKAGTGSRPATAHPDTVYKAPWPAYPIVTPRYIYQPGFTGVPAPSSVTDECAEPGDKCADEQLCEYWGTNCP
jgi:hypothetical protein